MLAASPELAAAMQFLVVHGSARERERERPGFLLEGCLLSGGTLSRVREREGRGEGREGGREGLG